MTVTFDSVELIDPAPFEIDPQVLINDTILESGEHSIQSSTETAISVTFHCTTSNENDVTNLRAKIGTEASLVIDSDTYTKCHIASFKSSLWAPGVWTYTVSFKQDTT